MFGKKKKKTIFNEVFGEMIHWGVEWKSMVKVDITLWNKTYPIDLSVAAATENNKINKKQENAWRYVRQIILERQKEIEEIIEEHYQIKDIQVLTSKFTPTEILFGKEGECALYLDDNDEEYGLYDDHDVGLAVSVIPEVKIYSQEEYDGDIFGGGSL